jgi:hypothetical protein
MPKINPPQLEISPKNSGNFVLSIYTPSDFSGYQTLQLIFMVQKYPYQPDLFSNSFPLDFIFYFFKE